MYSLSSTQIEARGCSMWTAEHRRAANRRGLRYPSDLTDAEWALVEPAIPPAKRGGRPRDVNVREVLNAVFYVPRRAASGRPCRRICRQRARCITTSCCGTGTARWSASTTSLYRDARTRRPRGEPDGRYHRQPKRQGRSKGGSALDPQGYDAGKKSRAASGTPSSHARPLAERRHRCGRCSGSPWPAARPRPAHAPPLPLHRAHLHRSQLTGTALASANATTATSAQDIVMLTKCTLHGSPQPLGTPAGARRISPNRRLARDFGAMFAPPPPSYVSR